MNGQTTTLDNKVKVEKVTVTTMQRLNTGQVSSLIAKYKAQIEAAIPKHMTAERMIQIATTLIVRNPSLAECTIPSLIGAVVNASILGLEPIPQLAQCYFVPFKNNKVSPPVREVQFIIGYKGMIALARRSGEITTVYGEVVYEKDEFIYELGLEPKLIHKPAAGERGNMLYVYAVMKYVNGGYNFGVLSKHDVEKVRRRAQSQQEWKNGKPVPSEKPLSIWATDYEAMAIKTAIKAIMKYAPASIEKPNITDGAIMNVTDFKEGKYEGMPENADYSVVTEQKETEEEPHKPSAEIESASAEPETKEPVIESAAVVSNEDTIPELDDSDPNFSISYKYWITEIRRCKNLKELQTILKEQKSNLNMFSGDQYDAIMEEVTKKENEFKKSK